MIKKSLVSVCLLLMSAACSFVDFSSAENVTGILSLGHEVRSFKTDGKDFWIVDKSGMLSERYLAATKAEIAKYQPTVAVLNGRRLSKANEGFAADYDGMFEVRDIVSIKNLQDFMRGDWVEHIGGNPAFIQGFSLNKDGNASSINMATLKYHKWNLDGDKLVLLGTSIGNHQSLDFNDTYRLEIIDDDTIFIIKNGYKMKMYRL